MPFKKTKADSKVFIGRTSELLFFIQHILKPEDPTYHIISISLTFRLPKFLRKQV